MFLLEIEMDHLLESYSNIAIGRIRLDQPDSANLSKSRSINRGETNTHTPHFGYSPPLTNLAAQTEFSQPQKDCSGSSKDANGL